MSILDKIIEKKEKNLNELLDKLNALTSTYSHSNYDTQKIVTEKNDLLRQKSEIEKKNNEYVTDNDVLISKPIYGSGAKKTGFNQSLRYIRITDITDDGRLREEDPVSPSNIESDYFLNKNDFLIARSGSVGRSYLHNDTKIPCQFAGYLIKFPLDTDKINTHYLFLITKSQKYWDWISRKKKDGTISNINAKEYCQFTFPLPPKEVQQSIINELEGHVIYLFVVSKVNNLNNKIHKGETRPCFLCWSSTT